MAHESIIAQLEAERDRLTAAIELLRGGSSKRIGRPRKDDPPAWVTSGTTAKPKRKTRKFTKAQRLEQAERARKMWAARKKAAKGGTKKAAAKAGRVTG